MKNAKIPFLLKSLPFLLGMLLLFIPNILAAEKTLEDHEEEPLPVYEGVGGDFTLITGNNQKINLQDFKGKLILLNFGYTFCPDICPMILDNLKQVTKKLGPDANKVQTLFITFDPERDTPEVVQTYVEAFDESFIGLTGSPEQIAAVAKQYGAQYFVQEVEGVEGYFLAHTDYIYLYDDKQRIRAFYKGATPVNEILKNVQQLLKEDK